MAEETKTEKKIELTFDRKIAENGWGAYYLSWKATDLENPDKTQGTVGFRDAVGAQQVIISLPADEWIKLLTVLAKKAAKA